MAKIVVDPVPAVLAGIQTIKCSECDWETVTLVPEESTIVMCKILDHIQQHGIEIPTFTAEIH